MLHTCIPTAPPGPCLSQPKLTGREKLEKCFCKEPLCVCFLIQGEAGSFSSHSLSVWRIRRMSLFWLRARCLHTAKSGSDATRGGEKSTSILGRKAPGFLVLRYSSALFFFLFERNVISTHKMDQAFYTSNNNLAPPPSNSSILLHRSLCERVTECTGERVWREAACLHYNCKHAPEESQVLHICLNAFPAFSVMIPV